MTKVLDDTGRILSCLLHYGRGYQGSSNIWDIESVTPVEAEDDSARRLGHLKEQHCQFLHNRLLMPVTSSYMLSAGTTSLHHSHLMHFSRQCPRDCLVHRTHAHPVLCMVQEIRVFQVGR